MEQLFITPAGELRDRWMQAFPNARVASSTADIGAATSKARGVVWLDVAVTSPEDRIAGSGGATSPDRDCRIASLTTHSVP